MPLCWVLQKKHLISRNLPSTSDIQCKRLLPFEYLLGGEINLAQPKNLCPLTLQSWAPFANITFSLSISMPKWKNKSFWICQCYLPDQRWYHLDRWSSIWTFLPHRQRRRQGSKCERFGIRWLHLRNTHMVCLKWFINISTYKIDDHTVI